jgi:integrase/recombinase XerC
VLQDYTAAMRRRSLSPGTIVKREHELRHWLDAVGAGWPTATADDVEAWLDGRRLSARSRYCALSHLSAFYRWAIRDGRAEVDPTVRIDRPKLPRRLPRPARRDLVVQAVDEAPPVMRAVLLCMVLAGLRCCEVARLDWRDVDLADRTAMIAGKGDRDRVVGLPSALLAALAALDGTAGPVFPGWQAEASAPGRIVSARVNDYLRRHGAGCTAHQLRHRYATNLLAATSGNLLAVQQALGHASVATTQVYALVDPSVALVAAAHLTI